MRRKALICLRALQNPSKSFRQPVLISTFPYERSGQGRMQYATESSLPRVAQPSLWHSIVPKFMRRSNQTELREKAPRSKDWNPATFFIVLSLLIGSNAMQLLALRNEFTAFSRRADAKIGLLKEVIERVQKGEDVDVKGLLGTGNPEKEKEWEEVIREVEEEDRLWQAKERRQQKRDAAKAAEGPGERNAEDKTAASNETLTENQHTDTADTPPDMRKGLPGFY